VLPPGFRETMMDLNYLYSRHQISLINAGAAKCLGSRTAHLNLAKLYARRINSLRRPMLAEPATFSL
jgi:hypothetical protein